MLSVRVCDHHQSAAGGLEVLLGYRLINTKPIVYRHTSQLLFSLLGCIIFMSKLFNQIWFCFLYNKFKM